MQYLKKMAIFLRGINVNGISIKMDELKNVLESMMYIEVKTVLATGNVILTAEDDHISYEDHKDKIEQKLRTHFGYEAFVIIKSDKQIYNMIEESMSHKVPEGYHHYILLSKEIDIGEQLGILYEKCNKAQNEQLLLGEYGIYWIVPKGDTLQSDFGKKILGRKEFKSIITSRTVTTIQKMSKYLW